MAGQSVYSVPQAELEMPHEAGAFGGFNRLQYFLFSMGIGVASQMLAAIFPDTPAIAMISILAAIGASIGAAVLQATESAMDLYLREKGLSPRS